MPSARVEGMKCLLLLRRPWVKAISSRSGLMPVSGPCIDS